MKQLVFGIFVTSKASERTMNDAWKITTWSLGALYAGKFPTHDHNGIRYPAHTAEGTLAGQDLADGMCCVVWILKGDLKYFAEELF